MHDESYVTRLIHRSRAAILEHIRVNSVIRGKCRVFTAGHTAQGYARVKVPGWRWDKCSRVLWRLHFGEIPQVFVFFIVVTIAVALMRIIFSSELG